MSNQKEITEFRLREIREELSQFGDYPMIRWCKINKEYRDYLIDYYKMVPSEYNSYYGYWKGTQGMCINLVQSKSVDTHYFLILHLGKCERRSVENQIYGAVKKCEHFHQGLISLFDDNVGGEPENEELVEAVSVIVFG